MHLESRGLAANTINQQLAAVRRIAHEAADSGLLSPELAAGISRVKGVKQLGFRSGNWLSADESSAVLKHAYGPSLLPNETMPCWPYCLVVVLRRSELVGLKLDEIQMRQGHWAIVDLIGKGGHIRTVPIPQWAKAALDLWIAGAGVTEGAIFRAVARTGKVWGIGISQNGTWSRPAVRERAWSILRLTTCGAMREAVPQQWRRTGTDSILAGACIRPDNRTLSRLQTKSGASGKRSFSPQNGRAAAGKGC
jgi:integrase